MRSSSDAMLSDFLIPDRFIVRDFVYSEEQIAKQREELDMADTTEKELWVSYTILAEEQLFTLVADGTPSAVQDKFFGIVSDSRPLESYPSFC